MPRLKGFRFPREFIPYAMWAYHRFALSTADVEDLLAERGVIVSREAIHSPLGYATLEWVDWLNNRRLLEPIGNIPPAEAEANFYAAPERPDMAA